MKLIYLYDDNNIFIKGCFVDDEHVLAVGETDIKPDGVLYDPITFDGEKWVSGDQSSWSTAQADKAAKYLADHPVEATETEKALASLSYQLMTLQGGAA